MIEDPSRTSPRGPLQPQPLAYRRPAALSCLFLATLLIACPTAGAQSTSDRVEAFLQKSHRNSLFNGSALVVRNGEVVFKGGFGEADMSWHIPNAPDTKFRIGSTTKQFTATLVLTLVEEKRIDLQGKVADYLPNYPMPQGNRLRIHHLLSHTSGIRDYTRLPGFLADAIRDPFDVDSLVALFSGLELAFDPGAQWSYSNSNYILLGAIIEAVTGKPYDQALRERVLDPLGLNNTGYEHYEDILQQKATGYYKSDDGYRHAPYLDTSVPYSAGMLYSTVEDLYKWDQALYGNGPFQRVETEALMFTPYAAIPPELVEEAGLPPNYGYGWFVGDVQVAGGTVKVIEHGGTIFGFATVFMRMPDDHNTIILLDNTMSGSIREVGRGIRSILYGGTAIFPEKDGG